MFCDKSRYPRPRGKCKESFDEASANESASAKALAPRPTERVQLNDQSCYFGRVEESANILYGRATRYLASCHGSYPSCGHAPGGCNLAGASFFRLLSQILAGASDGAGPNWRVQPPFPRMGNSTTASSRRSVCRSCQVATLRRELLDAAYLDVLVRRSFSGTSTASHCGRASLTSPREVLTGCRRLPEATSSVSQVASRLRIGERRAPVSRHTVPQLSVDILGGCEVEARESRVYRDLPHHRYALDVSSGLDLLEPCLDGWEVEARRASFHLTLRTCLRRLGRCRGEECRRLAVEQVEKLVKANVAFIRQFRAIRPFDRELRHRLRVPDPTGVAQALKVLTTYEPEFRQTLLGEIGVSIGETRE
jgi:hypothetical protein